MRRSSCYALLFFLKHSSMRLMLGSGITRLGSSWNFQHALGATLLTSTWNCQRSLDASLPTCPWDFESAFGPMVSALELPTLS